MLSTRLMAGLFAGSMLVILSACSEEVKEEPMVRLPQREHTWVRTEKVKKTKEAFFAAKEVIKPKIPVNEVLARKLTENPPPGIKPTVTDAASCLALVKPLDVKRTAVQKAGGIWHTFESSPVVRPYSDLAMQIDRKINETMSGLRHLCETARGIPFDNIARVVTGKIAKIGREAVREEFIALGKPEADVDIWLKHAEYYKKNEKRNLDYKLIENLILKVGPLIDSYQELSQKTVDETTRQSFLSDSETLLKVLKDLMSADKYMVLAVLEEKEVPYENVDPDM
ncbi:MAG: hypothetical protein ACE5E9_09095 [Nitrospinaceae bacterium]